jgi:hypothetical protein
VTCAWAAVPAYDPPIRWLNRDRFILSNGHAPAVVCHAVRSGARREPEYERLGIPRSRLFDTSEVRTRQQNSDILNTLTAWASKPLPARLTGCREQRRRGDCRQMAGGSLNQPSSRF